MPRYAEYATKLISYFFRRMNIFGKRLYGLERNQQSKENNSGKVVTAHW